MKPPKSRRLPNRSRKAPRVVEKAQAELTITIDLSSAKAAETVAQSVKPETENVFSFRSTTSVSADGKTLKVHIVAQDLTALRAASNSFLHFVMVAMKTIETVAPFYSRPSKPRKNRVEST